VKDGPLQLIINPGSTTTKISLYKRTQEVRTVMIEHERAHINRFGSVTAQREYRRALISEFLAEHRTDIPDGLDLVMGRGGLLHSLSGGVYGINTQMLSDLSQALYGEHASNLGAMLASDIASAYGCSAYIADPVVVDEMADVARVSGLPELERKSIFHALNQRIAARETAERIGKSYQECNLIVAHLGGGISIGAHSMGRVVDVNNALDGEGPFTPERSGTLPAGDLARLCFSGLVTSEQLQKRICGRGGVVAYLGTSDMKHIEQRAGEDPESGEAFYLRAMVYQIVKEIGSLAAALKGRVDGIVLTGGMANSGMIVEMVSQSVSFLAPIFVIPGEREMLSLAENGTAVYDGIREVLTYERI
jgi:butyrate kinase